MQVPKTQGAVYETYGLTAKATTLIVGDVLRAAKARASRGEGGSGGMPSRGQEILKFEKLKTPFLALSGRKLC